jgi:hypothetical protein
MAGHIGRRLDHLARLSGLGKPSQYEWAQLMAQTKFVHRLLAEHAPDALPGFEAALAHHRLSPLDAEHAVSTGDFLALLGDVRALLKAIDPRLNKFVADACAEAFPRERPTPAPVFGVPGVSPPTWMPTPWTPAAHTDDEDVTVRGEGEGEGAQDVPIPSPAPAPMSSPLARRPPVAQGRPGPLPSPDGGGSKPPDGAAGSWTWDDWGAVGRAEPAPTKPKVRTLAEVEALREVDVIWRTGIGQTRGGLW